jgi:hypothetical protein
MAYSVVELTIVLANLAPVTASWHALCLNRGDLERGGVVVTGTSPGGLEGAVDSDPYEV